MNLQGKKIQKLTLSLLLLFWASLSFAANVESIGTGSWTNGTTWSGGLVPTAADDVTVKDGHNVTATGAIDYQSIVIEADGGSGGGTLTLGGTTFNSSGSFVNNGTINWLSGNIVGGAGSPTTITNATGGLISLNGNNVNSSNIDFINQVGGSIIRSGPNNLFINNGDFENSGTLQLNSARNLNFINNTVTNNGDIIVIGVLIFQNIDFVSNTGSTIDGAGTLNLLGTNTLSGTAAFEPATANVVSSLNASTQELTSSSNHAVVIPLGTSFNASGLTLSGLSGVTNEGTITTATTVLDTDVTNNATMDFLNGNVTTTLGTFPTITNSASGTIIFNQNNGNVIDINFVNQAGGTIIRSGSNNMFFSNGDFENSGTFQVNSAKSLNFINNTVTNNGDIIVIGLLIFQNIDFVSNTGSTIDGAGTLNLLGTNTLSGTTAFEPGTANVVSFTNASTQELTSSSNHAVVIPLGTSLNAGGLTLSGLSGLTNEGTITTAFTVLDADVTNNATMDFLSGNVTTTLGTNPTITNSASGTIIFNQNNGNVIDINFVNQAGGTIIRSGSNNMFFSNGDFENSGTFQVNSAKSLNFINNTVTNNGDIIVIGLLNFQNLDFVSNTGSTIDGAGTLNLLGTNTLSGTAAFEPGTANVVSFTNASTQELTSSSNHAVVIPLGTSLNAGGLTLSGLSGLTNEGTITTAFTVLDADVTNNATMDFLSGNVTTTLGTNPTITNSASGTITFNQNNGSVLDINFVNQTGGTIIRNGANNLFLTGDVLNELGATITVLITRSVNFFGTFTNNGLAVNNGLLSNNGLMNGTGDFQGNIQSIGSGALAPGLSPGTLNFANNYTANQAGVVFSAEIAGTTPDTEHDQIIVGGTAFIGGILETSFAPAYGFTTGDVITLIDAATVSGTFASVTPALPADWAVMYDYPNAGEVSLEYSGPGTGGAGVLEFIVGNPTSGPNNTVVVPITVENFNNIATYQGSITFDPAELTYVSGSYPVVGASTLFGAPGQGIIPLNTVTFSWIDPAFATTTLADGTTVMELTFTVNPAAVTGSTSIDIDGSTTDLGYSDDVAATTLDAPTVVSGGVTIDADPPTVVTALIASNNATTTLAKAGDVITLTFTTSETPAVTPVVIIVEGGAGAVTVSGSGTAYTATKTVATGGDGVVTFSIQIEDIYGNSSTETTTSDASSVTVDTELPTIVCPGDLTPSNDAGLCSADVSWSAPAGADNRTGFSVSQTAGPASGSTFNVSASATTITYTVTDEAGNVASCDFTVLVSDTEDPVVVTTNITVQLDASGNASITPANIENGSTDNCGINPAGFSLDVSSFDCTDVGPTNPVVLTVTDVNGNTATGPANVIVEEVGVINISGEARTEPGTTPAQVVIPNVIFDVNTFAASTQTGSSYAFALSFCGTSDIGADKADASNNGINVQDAIDVIKHVLGIQTLATPYKLIAADVNASTNLNVLDVIGILRKTIGAAPFSVGNWTFIPDDHVFADPANPWTFPTRRSYTTPTPLTGEDFIGVKYGDVNNSYNNAPTRPAPFTNFIKFAMDQVVAQPGDLVSIPVRVKDFTSIAGYQYTLNWDPSVLQFESVTDHAFAGIYSTDDVANGNLASAWVDMAGQAITLQDGELAFELTFRVVGQMDSQTSFQMTSSMTPSQAFAGDRSVLGVTTEPNTLVVGSSTAIDPLEMEGYKLGQNFPNPFTSSTAFEFSLGQSEEVSIEIYSLTGQVVRSFEGRYAAGDHSLEWNGASANGTPVSQGIYFVRLKAGAYSSSIRVQKF